MSRSNRMQRIANISRNSERAAALLLSVSQRDLSQQNNQLNELVRYREEYRARLRTGSAATMSGYEAQKLRVFITHVDSVIEGLRTKIGQTVERYDGERATWIQRQRRSNAIDDIAGRELKLEESAEECRSQRESDDQAPGRRRGA